MRIGHQTDMYSDSGSPFNGLLKYFMKEARMIIAYRDRLGLERVTTLVSRDGSTFRVVMPETTEQIVQWQNQLNNEMAHQLYVVPALAGKAAYFAVMGNTEAPVAVGYVIKNGNSKSLAYFLGRDNELLNETRPDLMEGITRAFSQAGSLISTSNVNQMGYGQVKTRDDLYQTLLNHHDNMSQALNNMVDYDGIDDDDEAYEDDPAIAVAPSNYRQREQNFAPVTSTVCREHRMTYPGFGRSMWCSNEGCSHTEELEN